MYNWLEILRQLQPRNRQYRHYPSCLLFRLFVYYSVESRIRRIPIFKDGIGWQPTFSGGRERAVRLIITIPFFCKQTFDFILYRRIPLWISFKISGFNCVGKTVLQSFNTALKIEIFVIEGTEGQFVY